MNYDITRFPSQYAAIPTVTAADPDISFGGNEGRAPAAEGARIEAPKAPSGVGRGCPPPQKIF